MTLPPHEIYAEQLILLGCYGYPLWQANPFDDPPVDIADVGFVKRGSWVKMFNATKPPDDPSNQYGLPEGHSPIPVGRLLKGSLPASQPIYSRKVECLRLGADIGETGLPVEVGLAFKCSKAKGAALVLKEDTVGREVLEVKRFVSYMFQNYKQWLAFAEACGYAVALKDMIFVTGYERTSAWASAAFSENSTTCEVKFAFGKANLSIWGSWETHHPVFTNYGTSRKLNIEAGGGSGSVSLPQQTDSVTNLLKDSDHRDQCVFLKGFRICDRKTAQLHLFPRRVFNGFTNIYPKDKNLSYGNKESGSGGNAPHGASGSSSQPSGSNPGGTFSRQHQTATQDVKYDMTPGGTESELLDDHLLFDHALFSPWDVLFLYIFENSEADVAIIRDDDFAIFSKKIISNVIELYNELNEIRPEVFISDSLGVLDANLLKKELIKNDKPVPGNPIPSPAYDAPSQEGSATVRPTERKMPEVHSPLSPIMPSYAGSPSYGFSGPLSRPNQIDNDYNLPLDPPSPVDIPGSPHILSPPGSDMSRASSFALSIDSSHSVPRRYPGTGSHPRRRRPTIDKDDLSGDSDHEALDTKAYKFQQTRKEATRRQRIEAEQLRRDELRDGYARLKDVLPVTNQKSSKVSLLERAANYIRLLEERVKTLNTRFETQGDFPARSMSESKKALK